MPRPVSENIDPIRITVRYNTIDILQTLDETPIMEIKQFCIVDRMDRVIKPYLDPVHFAGFLSNKAILVASKENSICENSIDFFIDGKLIGIIEPKSELPSPLLEQNQIFNSAFDQSDKNWQLKHSDENQAKFGVNVNQFWNAPDRNVATLYQDESDLSVETLLVYNHPSTDGLLPVAPCSKYQVSGFFGFHGCDGEIVIEFLYDSGKLTGVASEYLAQRDHESVATAGFSYVSKTIDTPSEAGFARLSIRKFASKKKEIGKISGDESPLGLSVLKNPAPHLKDSHRTILLNLRQETDGEVNSEKRRTAISVARNHLLSESTTIEHGCGGKNCMFMTRLFFGRVSDDQPVSWRAPSWTPEELEILTNLESRGCVNFGIELPDTIYDS